jgi:hypothetical protein
LTPTLRVAASNPAEYFARGFETARENAAAAGVGDRVTFEVAPSRAFSGKDYDMVAFFDCQAGPAKIESVVRYGGFTRFRTATETPFNMVFEARA